MLTKIMGSLLFLVGLVLIILAALAIFDLLKELGPYERWVVFASGLVVCVIGYLMARAREEPVEVLPIETSAKLSEFTELEKKSS